MNGTMFYDGVKENWEVFAGSQQIAAENTREEARKTALEVESIANVEFAWPYFKCDVCGKICPYDGDMEESICHNQDCGSDQISHLCGPKETGVETVEWPNHDYGSNSEYFIDKVLGEQSE